MFKVDDRVEVIVLGDILGTIKGNEGEWFAVEMDNVIGHSCNNIIPSGRGHWARNADIRIFNPDRAQANDITETACYYLELIELQEKSQ